MKPPKPQPPARRETPATTSGRGAGQPRSPSELLVPTRPPKPARPLKAQAEPRRQSRLLRFLDGSLSFVFVALILFAAVAIWLRQSFDAPGPLAEPAAVSIAKGEGALEIAERLEKSGIIKDRRVFMLQYYVSRLNGGQGHAANAADKTGLKAGEYQFPQAASVRQVLDTIVSGKGVLQKLTVPEGLTSQQIIDRVRAEPGLVGEVTEVPGEGSLLPDTYRFQRGTTRQEIVDRMKGEHAKLVAALWPTRDAGVPLETAEQALVLASIVEKETGRANERPKVAAVFVNRLRKGMRLQSDPTIVYGLVGGQGPLGRPITRSDIDSQTPYNTYKINGLPPGPICNPGRAAIAAVLNPPATQDLYFVADGTGGHVFTSTLKDHNAAVQNWRKVERTRQSSSSSNNEGQGTGVSDVEAAPAAAAPQPTVINAGKGAPAAVAPVAKRKAKAAEPAKQ